MIGSRLAWAAWALVPVIGISYHFGPGQVAVLRDKAARLQGEALDAEKLAHEAQSSAYASHLAVMELRRVAFIAPTAESEAKLLDAIKVEDAAYMKAAEAWKHAAERIQSVQIVFGDKETPESRELRLAHARALVRAGEVWSGIESLEALLADVDTASTDGQAGSSSGRLASLSTSDSSSDGTNTAALATRTREELATAYYYGARILRLSGMPAQEWMVESGKSRQHFRYLAESERDAGSAAADNHQRNLELVLNLEQSSLAELQAKPIPRESPSKCQGTRPCSNCKGKNNKPPQQKKDARGAGGAGAIPPGW